MNSLAAFGLGALLVLVSLPTATATAHASGAHASPKERHRVVMPRVNARVAHRHER